MSTTFRSSSERAGSLLTPQAVLGLPRLPARLTAEQVAALLGFAPWDIPLLVKKGCLKPLGRSATRNCVKYFATAEVENLANDRRWLDAATRAVSRRAAQAGKEPSDDATW